MYDPSGKCECLLSLKVHVVRAAYRRQTLLLAACHRHSANLILTSRKSSQTWPLNTQVHVTRNQNLQFAHLITAQRAHASESSLSQIDQLIYYN